MRSDWPLLIISGLLVAIGLVLVWRLDDGAPTNQRGVYIGTCGGIQYAWRYDPRTVPSGADCVVEQYVP